MTLEPTTFYSQQTGGVWTRATGLFSLVGAKERWREALAFMRHAERAEDRRGHYGLLLLEEPHNRKDPDALAVFGEADVTSLLRRQRKTWQLGYVPSDLARDVTRHLILQRIPVSIELRAIRVSGREDVDIKCIILRHGQPHSRADMRPSDPEA